MNTSRTLIALAAISSLLTSCGQAPWRLHERANQISPGMSARQVQQTLGLPATVVALPRPERGDTLLALRYENPFAPWVRQNFEARVHSDDSLVVHTVYELGYDGPGAAPSRMGRL